MYLDEKNLLDIYNRCSNNNQLDITREIEKADMKAFVNKTGGSFGDYYHKRTLNKILNEGYKDENPRPHYSDGTLAHTISINEVVSRYDLTKGECPILTLRPIAWKSAVKEIFWIYQMQSNKLEDLHNLGIKYWDDWNIGDNTIGQRYGATVKKYDLMNILLNDLKNDPYGRRHIIELWQVEDFKTPGLNPCCHMTTWNVRNDGITDTKYLDMELKQRSSDFATSVSINELQYVALLLMVAKHLGYTPGVFTHVITNTQIYDRHINQAKELINRKPIPNKAQLILDTDKTNFYDFTIDDFKLIDYPLDKIKNTNPQLKFDLGI